MDATPQIDDRAALQRYAATRDPEAFACLVRRHIDTVYASARRQVADPGLAEDVTQAVFILLSQNAARLKNSTILIGWLLRTTHFVCRDARIREARRRFHETKATLMRNANAESYSHTHDTDWDAIRPHLDQALLALGSVNRAAVALRFLENNSLREVGDALGISEEAARKRVDRGLAHLRKALASRGIITPAALGATLIAKSAQAAPPLLTAAVLAPATKGAAALAIGGARLLFWTQLKFATAIAASLIIFTTAAAITIKTTAHRIAPFQTIPDARIAIATEPAEIPISPDVPLAPIVYRGQLVDPAGRGVSNAAVRAYWNQSPNSRLEWSGQTTSDGTFVTPPLPPVPTPASPFSAFGEARQERRIFLFDAPGYALTWWWPQTLGLITDPAPSRIILQRPAPVAGVVADSQGHPIAGATLDALVATNDGHYFDFNAQTGLATTSDAQGKFRFDRIPEGARMHLSVHHPDYCDWSTQFGGNFDYTIAAGTNDVEVKLAGDPATLRVQLTQNGKPIAKAGVLIAALWLRRQEEIQPTDAAGRVEFHGLDAGSWTLTNVLLGGSNAAIFSAPAAIALLPRQQQEVSLELGAVAVHGIELDADSNQPIRTSLYVMLPDGRKHLARIKPDLSGRFELLLSPGQYVLQSSSLAEGREMFVNQPLTIVPGDSELNVTMKLHDLPILRGRLADAAGKPIPGFVVVSDGTRTLDDTDVTIAAADTDGRFAMRLSPSTFDMGTPASAFAIDSSRKLGRGFLLTMPEPGTPDIEVVLEPMATLLGNVVDRNGRPSPDARLQPLINASWTFQAGAHTDAMEDVFTFQNWIWKSTIDGNGVFRVEQIPVGYELDFHLQNHDDWANLHLDSLQPGETRNLGAITLHADNDVWPSRPWDTTINGRLLNASGKPVPGATISAVIPMPPIPLTDGLGSASMMPEDLRGVSDLKGCFSIAGLPQGRSIVIRANLHDGNPENEWTITPSTTPIDLTLPLHPRTNADRDKAIREAMQAGPRPQLPAPTLP